MGDSMGMTEKKSLIDSITILFAEDYDLPIKEVKAKLTEIIQHYHVTVSEETIPGCEQTTQYLMRKFHDGKTAIGMSESTLRQYDISVQLLESYTKKQLSDIEPDDVNAFMKSYGQKVTSVTLRAKYQYLSSVYNYLFQHQFISYNPILYVDAPKASVIYKQPLTDIDVEKVKTVCEKLPEKESLRDTALIYTFISTGCRVSELANIQIKDIDFSTKTIKVLGKGRKERPVVINDKALYRINLYLQSRKNLDSESPLFSTLRGPEKKMSKDGISNVIRKLRTAAGVTVTCHSFRRFYATELRKRNVSIQMIASSLGHANLNQINRYSVYNSNEMLNKIRESM